MLKRLAFGKRYLACQLGSRVGMLKQSCQILDSKKSPKFPRIFPNPQRLKFAGFTEYLKPYEKSSPRSYVTESASTLDTTNRLRRSLTRFVGNQIPCSELVHCR